MKKSLTMDHSDIIEAVNLWLLANGHARLTDIADIKVQTNGQPPQPDPPFAQPEPIRVWVTIELEPGPAKPPTEEGGGAAGWQRRTG